VTEEQRWQGVTCLLALRSVTTSDSRRDTGGQEARRQNSWSFAPGSPFRSMALARFRAFRQFNLDPQPSVVSSPSTLIPPVAEQFFPGDSLHSAIVRSLALARCISIKEVVESFEVFQVVRKETRSSCVADLCCGHGLVGMLMAVFEPRVEAVHLCDPRMPESSARCLEAIVEVAPWMAGRVHYHSVRLENVRDEIGFASALATHACGALTDRCLDVAMGQGCPIAVTPCCYAKRTSAGPPVLVRELGLETAVDTYRTHRLHEGGYHVKWRYLPETVTPMNRVIIATPMRESH
jgi:hypothetical protein